MCLCLLICFYYLSDEDMAQRNVCDNNVYVKIKRKIYKICKDLVLLDRHSVYIG